MRYDLERRETERGHSYYLNGVKIPGVTTVLGCLSKPNLIYWASDRAVMDMAENLPPISSPQSLTRARELVRLAIEEKVKNVPLDGESGEVRRLFRALNGARYAHSRTKKDAAQVGTDVHELIRVYLLTGSYDVDGVDERVANAFHLFLDWWNQRGLVPLASELPVCSRALMVAGTFDTLAVDAAGDVWMLDYKSGKGIYREALAQAVTYRGLLEESQALGLPGTEGLPLPSRLGVLRIGREATEPEFQEVPREDWSRHWTCFSYLALGVYGWTLKGRCRFEAIREREVALEAVPA